MQNLLRFPDISVLCLLCAISAIKLCRAYWHHVDLGLTVITVFRSSDVVGGFTNGGGTGKFLERNRHSFNGSAGSKVSGRYRMIYGPCHEPHKRW